MATLSRDITIRHRPNLGEETSEIELHEGDSVTVLKQWENHTLCKDAEGRIFNLPKEAVSEG